ncbi:MAG: hypothetical protein JXR46_10150 [Calditrichaceae bacterium]|nr:hypothetical protein [Calditrichaceae bacterium]MBN2709395.1 hypothetical protein [Calditrichaceae bacterium]RQV95768.1 MAG: hypothetical protein EH224_06625 [Calditrichota bacterium]
MLPVIKNESALIKVLLLLVLTWSLSSCTYRQLIVTPSASDTFWKQGRQYVEQSDSLLRIVICHEKKTRQNLIFYAEITNTGEQPQLIDPSAFYFIPHYKSLSTDTSLKTSKKFLLDPEIELGRINSAINREESSHKTTQSLNAFFFLMGGVLGTVNAVTGNVDEASENFESAGETVDYMNEEQADHEHEMDLLENARSFWENEVLRKTTLYAGQTVGGLLIYPMIKKAKFISLYFPVGNSKLKFDFKQTWKRM